VLAPRLVATAAKPHAMRLQLCSLSTMSPSVKTSMAVSRVWMRHILVNTFSRRRASQSHNHQHTPSFLPSSFSSVGASKLSHERAGFGWSVEARFLFGLAGAFATRLAPEFCFVPSLLLVSLRPRFA
jgi:hypothetical protein